MQPVLDVDLDVDVDVDVDADVACKNTIFFRSGALDPLLTADSNTAPPLAESCEKFGGGRRGAWSLDLGNLRPCRVSAVKLFIHETMCRCTRAQSTRFYLIITNSDQTKK